MGHLFVRLGDHIVGELHFEIIGARQHSTFRYAPSWSTDGPGVSIAPGMTVAQVVISTTMHQNSSPLPMAIADSTPDSWGRAIMRAARGGAHMNDFDFLVGVDDFLRSGALRFFESPEPGALPLAQPRGGEHAWSVPRMIDLEALVHEARAFEADPIHYRENRAHLLGGLMLAGNGGSLGGARPKVNVRHDNGDLWIAKLPRIGDEYDMARTEVLAMRLAGEIGIDVADTETFTISKQFPIAMIKRFDRTAEGRRRHMITAQTFLQLPGTEPSDYVTLADQMLQFGGGEKVGELWLRMAYSVLIQNCDDHLRNHAFLIAGQDWILSPAYDINPDPAPGGRLKTAISEIHGNELNVGAVLDSAELFHIGAQEAREALKEMAERISKRWRLLAHELGMNPRDIQAIRPAFDNPQIRAAMLL